MDRAPRGGDPDFVDLVAACIDGYTHEGPAAVERILEAHPETASRLRARLRHLDRLGLLGVAADPLPTAFGPYKVLRRLGRGGMSDVLLAHDPRMDREVALKTCHPSMALEARARQRFQREVRAVAKLSHPAIVPVYDVGEAETGPYFTMEFVEGATLASVLGELRGSEGGGRGSLGERVEQVARYIRGAQVAETADAWKRPYLEIVARWTTDLANALEHAHAAGVVHRDVKPDNIIVRTDGRVQLLDFGLARLGDAPSLTRFGEFTGTPYYVSPEQLAGDVGGRDASCDVYSMGVTLYELLTLRRPFEGASTSEVLSRIQSDVPVAPRKIDPRVPRDLELICLLAMERDRRRRYPSMRALAEDLGRFLAFEPVHARPLGPIQRTLRFARRRPAAAASMVLGAVLLIAFTAAFWRVRGALHGEREAARIAGEAAQRSAQLAQHMESFIGGLIDDADYVAPGFPVDDLIQRGLDRLPQAGGVEDGGVRTALLEAGGRAYARMGQHARAVGLLNRAALDRAARDRDDPHLVETRLHLSEALLATGDAEEAHTVAQGALNVLDRAGIDNTPMRRRLWLVQAEADQQVGRTTQVGVHVRAAIATLAPGDAEADPEQLDLLERLGRVGIGAQRWDLASMAFGRWLSAVDRDAWTVDPLRKSAVRSQLAQALRASGDEQGARDQEAQVERTRARLRRWASLEDAALPDLPLDVAHTSWRAEYTYLFSESWRHLTAGNTDRAREGFRQALRLRPEDPLSAYNLGCVATREGDTEAALAWLERSLDWGFGTAPNQTAETLFADHDLRDLRGEPRFARILERARDASAAGPRIDVRPQEAPSRARPLLIRVLPSDTTPGTDDQALEAALALGWHTVSIAAQSPSGPGNPGWLERATYGQFIPALRESLGFALRPALDGLLIEPGSVLLIADGDAGPVATSFTLHHPGLVRGLVLLDSYPGPEYRTLPLRDAALVGLGVTLLDRADVPIEWIADTTSEAEWTDAVVNWFGALALDAHAEGLEAGADLKPALVRALQRARAVNAGH